MDARAGRQLIMAAIVAAMVVQTSPATALVRHRTLPAALKPFHAGGRAVTIHPFTDIDLPSPRGLALFGLGQVSFDEAMHHVLGEQIASPLVQIRGRRLDANLGLNANGSESNEYRLYIRGVPLCGFQIVAHQLADRSSLVLGQVPDIDPYETAPTLADWPDQDLAVDMAIADLQRTVNAHTVRAATPSRCLYLDSGRLLPIWEVPVTADGLPYRVRTDAYEVISSEPRFFDVDGTGTAFEFNKLTGAPVEWKLSNLKSDGTLNNGFLQTVIPAGTQQAVAANEVFTYDQSDARFDEVQAFVHTNLHFEWFKTLGFTWYGPQPLQIKLHARPGNTTNNALFTPGDDASNTLPTIQVGDGDGVALRNLGSDADVVSHEFGHLVIFRTLHAITGESLVLHEGLADTFAFFRTGNACLGESICPTGSMACVSPTCLRSGELPVQFNDSTWQRWGASVSQYGHRHGQLISGLMWDMRKSGALPPADETALLFKAISYFQDSSGFHDFLLALLTADRDLFQCKYDSQIRAAVTSRGLGNLLADIQPGCGTLPQLTAGNSVTTSNDTSSSTAAGSNSKTKTTKCGTVSGAPTTENGQSRAFLLFVLLAGALAPIALNTWQRRQKAVVRQRKGRKARYYP